MDKLKAPVTLKNPQRLLTVFGLPLLVLTFFLLITAALCWWVSQQNQRIIQQEMDSSLQKSIAFTEQRLQRYRYGLRGLAGVMQTLGEHNMTREQFTRYSQSRDLATEFPGASGFGFIRRVPQADEAAFVATTRRDGMPDFAVRQISPHEGERYIVQYIEPLVQNQLAIGLDAASEPYRQAAALTAMRSGEATLTAPVALIQGSGPQRQSFLFMWPIYRTVTIPSSEPARVEATFGWSYTVLNMPDVLGNNGISGLQARLTVEDTTIPDSPVAFYTSSDPGQHALTLNSYAITRSIYGREWRFTLNIYPAFVKALPLTSVAILSFSGILISLLLAIVTFYWQMNRRRKALLLVAQKNAEAEVLALNARLEEQVKLRTEELMTAQRFLRTILDSIPSLVGYWDKNLINRMANAAYHSWFGVEATTLPGRSLRGLLGEKLFQENQHQLDRVLRGESQTFTRAVITPQGRTLHSLVHYIPDISDGEVHGFYVVVHDVTELTESQIKLAAALRENELLLHTLNEQLLYSATDAKGVILEANDHFCEVHGFTREELLGQNHRMLNAHLHPPEFWQSMWDTLKAGIAWHGEVCNRARDGSLHWFDTVIAPHINSHNQVERYIALRIDITDRKASDAEISRLHILLSNVLEAASEVSIIATDLDGLITVFNTGAERMLGYREEEMVGITTPAPLHLAEEIAARGQALSDQFGQLITGFRVFVHIAEQLGSETREWTYVRKDGTQLTASIVVTAVRDGEGKITGYLGIGTDITDRKTFEMELLNAKQLAEQASVAKGQFLANMSHEIRTPMNAILGMLQLLRQAGLNVRQDDYASKAQTAARSLLSLLNDILDFSKIDAGKMELDVHPFSPEKLMRDLAVVLSGNLGDKDIELLFNLDPQLPTELIGDQLRLQQILINLAGNAIKFTQKGQVVVGLTTLERSQEKIVLRISVKDTGIGISPEQLTRIFDGFTQAEASTTRRYGGTGLGLAISKRLVTLMGSELHIDSQPGYGSEFWFDVSLTPGKTLPLMAMPASEDKRRILIVDDNVTAGQILSQAVETLGWEVEYCNSGKAAVARIHQTQQQSDAFDVVIMDWRMPEMDGVSAARLIKDRHVDGKPPVIIMVTAFGREMLAEIIDQQHAPFEDFLTKPVTPQQLYEAIQRAVDAPSPARAEIADKNVTAKQLQGVRLLLVEDNAFNRQVASELLTEQGAEVTLAEGGLLGVELATQRVGQFDAVVMDIQMPDIDGMEATRRIRADERFHTLPILAMTANVSLADKAACLAAGMNDHVGKPIDMAEVVPTLLRLIGRDAHAPLASSGSTESGATELVDPLAVSLKRFAGRRDIYQIALESFAPEGERLLSELTIAIQAKDTQGITYCLHTLKGIASTAGASGLAKWIGELEMSGKTHRPGEATSWLPEHVLTELAQQLSASNRLLLHAFAPEPEQPALLKTDAFVLSEQELAEQLRVLLAMLVAGNMAALDIADELERKVSEQERSVITDLARQVRKLDFGMAEQSVRKLLEGKK